jgi:hypothetical protein
MEREVVAVVGPVTVRCWACSTVLLVVPAGSRLSLATLVCACGAQMHGELR